MAIAYRSVAFSDRRSDAAPPAFSLPVQSQFPDTPAARQFSAWLTAFNSGDRATLLKFLQENNPARAGDIDREMQFRSDTGGFDFKKAEESTPSHFSGLLQEHASDQFAHFSLDVDPAEPHHISSLELMAVPRPAEFALPRSSEAELLAALREKLQKATAADKFSGAVLLAKNGKTVFSNAYGLADREKKIPNTLNTRFRIGSMNKMFTAVAILQLAQAGKLNLTDPLVKSLPDYPNKELASKVTIHHLLTHTGGTGDFFGPEFDAHRLELKTLQDYVTLYGKRPLAFEPGSKWAYSNYGFLLLGLVVQKVSGQDYYAYVSEHIYKPAGMTRSGSLPENESVADRSIGYTREDSASWRRNTDTLPYRGTSAGGGYSTVEDLKNFPDAVTGHKLLDAAHTELLTTGKVDRPGGEKYAYGFTDRAINGARTFGHGGGAPGMNGDLIIFPISGYVVAVLANLDPPAAQNISNFIANRVPEK
jgi:CubicO group peptidase (beta-lactamase class C family)